MASGVDYLIAFTLVFTTGRVVLSWRGLDWSASQYDVGRSTDTFNKWFYRPMGFTKLGRIGDLLELAINLGTLIAGLAIAIWAFRNISWWWPIVCLVTGQVAAAGILKVNFKPWRMFWWSVFGPTISFLVLIWFNTILWSTGR